MIKRVFDIAISAAALAITAPIIFLALVWVGCSSRGPIVFRQTRVGRNGRTFEILKFRTMYVRENPGRQITAGDDPRVTRAGRVLRRLKIDELLQFVNVLKGDMSVVGPRPEVPHYVAMYPEPLRKRILSIRPGLTDWASIRFRNEGDLLANATDPEELYVKEILPAKLACYEQYITEQTIGTDLQIVLATLRAIILDIVGWTRVRS